MRNSHFEKTNHKLARSKHCSPPRDCGSSGRVLNQKGSTAQMMTDFDRQRIAMVDSQIRPSDVTKYPIISAMLEIPLEEFVPDASRQIAYAGMDIHLSDRRVVLDRRVLAKMLNELNIRPDEFVLDIGCGMGYSSAIIARMAEGVVALEEDAGMAETAESNFARLSVDNAVSQVGPLAEGAPRHGPYDVITVQGGVEFIPDKIISQLKEGGKIGSIFCKRQPGECRVGIRRGSVIAWRMVFNAEAPILPGYEQKKEFVF